MNRKPPIPAPRQGQPAELLPSCEPAAQGDQIMVRRKVPLVTSRRSLSHEKLKEGRDSFVRNYLCDPKNLDGCAALIALDLPLDMKYAHLKLSQVMDLNKDKEKFLRLPQGLGILEKYASNLIKAQRPSYWRSVKFTSPVVRTHVSGLAGSRDILFQMGYTENIQDGVSFPEDVKEPNVEMLKDMAADLFLARYEIEALMAQTHLYLHLVSPHSADSTTTGQSKPGSAGSPRIPGSLAPSVGQVSSNTAQPQVHIPAGTSAEPETDSDSDSEYQDAEDGTMHAPPVSLPTAEDMGTSTPKSQCQVCGDLGADIWCKECRDAFCETCDGTFHKHPSRLQHQRSRAAPRKPAPEPARKRPVPKPRGTVPVRTSSHSGQLPPQEQTAHPVTPGQPAALAPSNQNRRREILRPPPFTSVSTPSRPSDQTAGNLGGTITSNGGSPPQLPPRPSSRQGVALPDKRAATPTNSIALSCPNCFHINAARYAACIVCKTPLRNIQSDAKSSPESAPAGESRVTGYLPESTVRHHDSPHRHSATGRGDAARQEPFGGNRETQSPVKAGDGSSSVWQHPLRVHAAPPPSSGAAHQANFLLEDGKWSCEHCTISNPQTTNICQMCSKTRTVPAGVKQPAPESQATSEKIQQFPRPPRQSKVITEFAKEEDRILREKMEAKRRYEEEQRRRLEERNAAEKAGTSTSGAFFSSEASPSRSVASREPMNQQELHGRAPQQHVTHMAAPVSTRVPPEQYMFGARAATEDFLFTESQSIQREQEKIYIGGLQMVEWMKVAETEGFQAEELNIATVLGSDDPEGPIHWLKTAWYDRVHLVMVHATQQAHDLGNLTPEEARASLIECTGDVARACVHCLDERRKKLSEISQNGVYPRTECIDVLDSNDGDVPKALIALEKKSMQPMLQRVLDSCLPDDSPDEQVVFGSHILGHHAPQDTGMFDAAVRDSGQNIDRRIRLVLVEKAMKSWGRAETAVKLMDMEFPVEDAVEAARQCGDVPRALRYLKQECPVCTGEKPMGQMITFLHCQDRFCRDCVSKYFSDTIKDRSIKNLTCMLCGKPDDLDTDSAAATEYFNNLDIMIRDTVDKEIHDLFQRKLRDRSLMKDPNFRWCQHCSSGFINEQPDGIKMTCPHCRKQSCFRCKQKWEDQHDGLTCEQFAAWKEANDPEQQAEGLAAHLKKHGIDCPNCKFRYDLAKGGCMHFKCVQCPNEFCSGCYNPYQRGERCRIAATSCAQRGLHAHHPRDCLFYLRDFPVVKLQQLLRDRGVEYDTEPPPHRFAENPDDGLGDQAQAAANAQPPNQPLLCKVMEQKETGDGLVDGECGGEVPANYAGLCRLHYSEYLVGLVNENLIDPADVMSTEELNAVLQRGGLQQLERDQEGDDEYRDKVLQEVKRRLPLPAFPPRRRVLGEGEQRQAGPGREPADLILEDLPDEPLFE